MNTPRVSVIIPTYKGADFLGEAIQSVLEQTYPNLELIVVDDASPDRTTEAVEQFDDPRIRYIRHEVNQGAGVARRTGCRNSSGEIIAFLDQDDMFHPEKLEAHVAFLQEHPDVGFTYNPSFELVHSSDAIRTVWQPPKNVSLAELTVGFYLAPSSWVMRREWVFQKDAWESHTRIQGREIIICGRLFMAGCKFARVDKVLHYRRYQAGRLFKELERKCEEELTCQETIFSDPRCPADVLSLRSLANSIIDLMWANVAFNQNDTSLGQKFVRDAMRVNPAIMYGSPPLFINFLMGFCVDDESQDYGTLLEKLFSQFPPEIPNIRSSYLWAISRGYLTRGVRAMIWDRLEDANRYMAKAVELKCKVDEALIQQATHELLGYELCHGNDAALEMLSRVSEYFENLDGKRGANWLKGNYLMNKANRDHHNGNRKAVPGMLLNAVASHPKYLFNQGVISTLIKSVLKPV